MKVRLFEQSIRVRLSQSEVAKLAATGQLSETLSFAGGGTLEYAIESGPALEASLQGSKLAITLPADRALRWATDSEVAISGVSGGVQISVEKDFQCLHGPESENPDAFPNPARINH